MPLADPLVWGVNVTENETLCPAAMVNGNETPLNEYSELLIVSEETVMLAPLAVIVAGKVELLPTLTSPKFRLVGVRLSWPVATPVPETAIVRSGSDALETIEMLPLSLPLANGANSAVNVMLSPEVKVMGTFSPEMLNPVPLAEACVMVTLDPPALVSVSYWLELLPTCTLPKFSELGLSFNCPPDPLPPVPLKAIEVVWLVRCPEDETAIVATT